MDCLPKPIQLIVYRYIFDVDYTEVKREYHKCNPHDLVEAAVNSNWAGAIVYHNMLINRRGQNDGDWTSNSILNLNFGKKGGKRQGLLIIPDCELPKNYFHSQLYP
jgi:hypothetical protein